LNLYLLRHGIAVERGTPGYESDFDRPLTSDGKEKMCKIAAVIRRMEIKFDHIFSSPYIRARQTAEIVARNLDPAMKVEFTDTLATQGTSAKVIRFLKELEPASREVMLVGHEPNLSELASLLCSGGTDSLIVFKKGGFCKLSTETLRTGRCASLEWLLTPRQLKEMS